MSPISRPAGLLARGAAFVVPSTHDGQPMVRICIVNPRTTVDDVRTLIESLA